jgi:choline dehydrogenase-like flavoprotein
MLIDANTIDATAHLETEVCIVGSGPAGLAVAFELTCAGIPVVVLEEGSRACIGGNATKWVIELERGSKNAVRLAPLETMDMTARDGVIDDGWPIGPDDLEPYYARAAQLFDISPFGFAAAAWEAPGARRLPFDENCVKTSVYQFADGGIFHGKLRDAIAASPHGRIIYNAAAMAIGTSDGGTRARAIEVQSPSGRRFEVRASTFVLAAGGLGNPHLLLLSRQGRSTAIGDEHGLLGRYFMDHPLLDGGDFVPSARGLVDAMALYDLRRIRNQHVMGHLRIGQESLLEHQLAQLSVMLFPRELDHRARYALCPRQERALRTVFEFRANLRTAGLRNLQRLPAILKGADAIVRTVARDALGRFPRLGRGGWSNRQQPSATFGAFQVVHQVEQPPRYDNRVFLGTATDAMGRPVLDKEWRWHDEDIARACRSQDFLAAELEAKGWGEYKIARDDGKPLVLTLSTAHPMGTTRMHADPKRGVVDADCRIHAVPNIYVASSSTFTSGGFVNPTFTIVALALRVAESVRRRHAANRPTLSAKTAVNPSGRPELTLT